MRFVSIVATRDVLQPFAVPGPYRGENRIIQASFLAERLESRRHVIDMLHLLAKAASRPTPIGPFADANALVAWSIGLQTNIKSSVTAGSLIGRGSGEAFQVAFSGQGFVIVQPSEGPPPAPKG